MFKPVGLCGDVGLSCVQDENILSDCHTTLLAKHLNPQTDARTESGPVLVATNPF